MIGFGREMWNALAKIVCGIAMLSMFLGAIWAVCRWMYVKRAVTTEGTITNLIERTAKDGDTLYAPVYVFTDRQGQTVKVTSSVASYPPPGKVGDKIEVLYDPENPQDSIVGGFLNVWAFPLGFGAIGAVDLIVFGAVAYFTGRRLEKNGRQTQ